MQLRLTPGDASAGETRIFVVRGFDFDTTSRELVLSVRDGTVCFRLEGLWQFGARPTAILPHTVDEAVAIQEGTPTLVAV